MAKIFILAFSAILFSQTVFGAKVELMKDTSGIWRLYVNGGVFFVKGVCYEPVKVGDKLSAANEWMDYDFNNNGINDCAYDSWVDKNRNNRQDPDEVDLGDFYLMKEMGVNAIRLYHHVNIKKEVLRDIYERFGIRVIIGNLLGAYCWGSGASWQQGTDYTNPEHCKSMLDDVKRMVLEHKDEPYLLMWLLGNENDVAGCYENSTFNNTNARLKPEVFAKFVNKMAEFIHFLDRDHPVGVCDSTYLLLSYYKDFTPAIDFIGFNSYAGHYGLSSLFRTVKFYIDKPVLISEFGADSYDHRKGGRNEDLQIFYHKSSWRDIVNNSQNEAGGEFYRRRYLYLAG
ncbi:MAG: glycoside hydrolase family 2 TIM barrel-domain containing protein [Candidatus Omnitrophota bacterium]